MATTNKQKVKSKKVVDLTKYRRDVRLDRLLSLFKKHIGVEKQITAYNLFKAVFGLPYRFTEMQIYYLWNLLKQDMNYLRRKTFCFIGSHWNGDTWVYYVIKTEEDAKPYIDRMINHVKRCTYMKNRCKKAVEEEFWKQL